MRQFYLFIIILLVPSLALAEVGVGEVADNLLGPVYIVSGFIGSASIVIGICALFGSFLRFMQYRINPSASPLSSVIVLFLIGTVLVCLPLIYKLTESGIPYALHS